MTVSGILSLNTYHIASLIRVVEVSFLVLLAVPGGWMESKGQPEEFLSKAVSWSG